MNQTREGWDSNLKDILNANVTTSEKYAFVQSYINWIMECMLDDMPNCDDCERIHPDDMGDYLADHRESYYDR